MNEAVDEGRVHARRRDAVAADIVGHVVARDGVSHREHRALAHGICEAVGQAGYRGNGGQIQDHATTAGLHEINRGVHAVINTFDVDAKNAVEVLVAGRLQLADMSDSGIVHQNMKRVAATYLAEDIFYLQLIRDVAKVPLRRAAVAANAGDRLFRTGFINFEDMDRGACLGERNCDCPSNAAGAACNDCDFAIQTK